MRNETTAPLAAIEVAGDTRQAFLLKAVLAGAAASGVGLVGPTVRRALAAGEMGDVDVLNFALTLEHLETAFYRVGRTLDLRDEVAATARRFGREEAEHVAALTATIEQLGGKPAAAPRFRFPVRDEASFLRLATTLEDTGVSAYNGAAPAIRSKEVLAAAGSIVQVEARHAAVIRLLRGKDPAPRGFDVASEKDAVVRAITPLIRSGA
ncbi:ferritin-like domain-containing protein [Patulibacter defluvii]|uniref:ferritin-like domain-containing protein n=1 Tax=Patulibacter defluvii TaxID=3095358 RepID=UPI002A75A063|nr:ferritin-like domain-containing protein [Patulibacter sp. DM4]